MKTTIWHTLHGHGFHGWETWLFSNAVYLENLSWELLHVYCKWRQNDTGRSAALRGNEGNQKHGHCMRHSIYKSSCRGWCFTSAWKFSPGGTEFRTYNYGIWFIMWVLMVGWHTHTYAVIPMTDFGCIVMVLKCAGSLKWMVCIKLVYYNRGFSFSVRCRLLTHLAVPTLWIPHLVSDVGQRA